MQRKAMFGRPRLPAIARNSGAIPKRFRTAIEALESRRLLAGNPTPDLLVADTKNSEVLRFVDDTSQTASGGVSPFADGMAEPDGLAVGPDGSYYVSTLIDLGLANQTGAVLHFSSTGAFLSNLPAYDADEAPASLAFGPNGNLYIVDNGFSDPVPNSTDSVPASIYQYNPNLSTPAIVSSSTLSLPQYYTDVGGAVYPGGLAFAPNGDLLLGNLDDGSVTQFHSNGSSVTTTVLIQQTNPGSTSNYYSNVAVTGLPGIASQQADANDVLCMDDRAMTPGAFLELSNGDLLIADFDAAFSPTSQAFHHQVLEYIPGSGSTSAQVKVFADLGSDAGTSPQQQPISLALDTDGNVLVGSNPDEGGADGLVTKYNIFSGASMGAVETGIGIPSGLGLIAQAPTVATSPGTTGYTAGAAGKAVDPLLMASTTSDDNVNLDGATITISGGFQTGDTLTFNNTANITGVVTTPDGVYTLTLSGSDTAADYQAALESITFSNASNSSTATRTISFTVTDGTASSLTATKQISIENLLVADTKNSEVLRFVDDTSQTASGGVSPFADGMAEPDGLAVGPDGSYYVSTLIDLGLANQTGAVLHFSSTGAFLSNLPAYDADEAPASLAFGPNGNLYIVDNGFSDPVPNSTDSVPASIYQYNPNLSTPAIVSSSTLSLPQYYTDVGGAVYPGGLAFAPNGDLLLGNLDDGSVTQFHSNGSSVTTTVLIQQTNPGSTSNYYSNVAVTGLPGIASQQADANDVLCMDDRAMTPGAFLELSNGDLLIADFDAAFSPTSQAFHHQVLEYIPGSGSTSAQVKVFADLGSDAGTSPQQQPISLALDTDGNVLVGSNPDEGGADGLVTKYNIFSGASMGAVETGIGIPSGLGLIAQAPTVATSPGTTGYTAGAAGKAVDPLLMASTTSDDNVNLDGATITISGGFQTGDTLTFNNTANITGVVTTPDGVYTLTLMGSDTAADYQAALESITFSNASNSSTATRTISFTVTDGTASSLTATKQINVSSPAEITGVYVSGTVPGSVWTSAFESYLATSHLGSATLGFALQTGASQLTTIPWSNINIISVQFNESVNVNTASLTAALTGSSAAATPPGTTVTYDDTTHVATFLLSSALPDNSYMLTIPTGSVTDGNGADLDGAFTNHSTSATGQAFPSGSGNKVDSNANFYFLFNVLPGATERGTFVLGGDVTFVRDQLGDSTTTTAGILPFSPYADVTGQTFILGGAVTVSRSALGQSLPAANTSPSPPAAPSVAIAPAESSDDEMLPSAAATQSSAAAPAVVQPGISSFSVVSPSIVQPASTAPVAAQPAVSQPTLPPAAIAETAVTETAVTQSEVAQVAVSQSVAVPSTAVTQVAVTQSTAATPAVVTCTPTVATVAQPATTAAAVVQPIAVPAVVTPAAVAPPVVAVPVVAQPVTVAVPVTIAVPVVVQPAAVQPDVTELDNVQQVAAQNAQNIVAQDAAVQTGAITTGLAGAVATGLTGVPSSSPLAQSGAPPPVLVESRESAAVDAAITDFDLDEALERGL